MIRNGNRIRLSPDEKRFLEGLVQEPVNPQSIQDHNAWIDCGIEDFSEGDPEERLYRRAVEGMKIEE
jgi:hypothetical protein